MFLQSFIVFIILLLSFPFYIKMPIGYNAVPCRAIQEFGIALELECARQDFAWLAGTDANARFDDVEVSVMIMSDITLLNPAWYVSPMSATLSKTAPAVSLLMGMSIVITSAHINSSIDSRRA